MEVCCIVENTTACMQPRVCIYNCKSLLATALMITFHSVSSGMDYIQVHWTLPKYAPERYQLRYSCQSRSTFLCRDGGDYVTGTMQSLNENFNTTEIKISELHPSSVCKLNLLAVYNPASIDSGIDITATTLPESSSRGTLFLRVTKFVIFSC